MDRYIIGCLTMIIVFIICLIFGRLVWEAYKYEPALGIGLALFISSVLTLKKEK